MVRGKQSDEAIRTLPEFNEYLEEATTKIPAGTVEHHSPYFTAPFQKVMGGHDGVQNYINLWLAHRRYERLYGKMIIPEGMPVADFSLEEIEKAKEIMDAED